MGQLLQKMFVGSDNETGELESEKILALVDSVFSGFTSYPGIGSWEGKRENCLIIEITTEDTMIQRVTGESLAMSICIACQQEAVLMHRFSSTLGFSADFIKP